MKKVLIDVTQECIDKGEPRACRSCPIALALKGIACPGFAVTRLNIRFLESDKLPVTYVSLPNEAIDFILAFDDRKKVAPFKFKLDIPERFLRTGN